MAKDYYGILGVKKDASQDDLKKAYKELAKKYHPDVNKDPGSEEKFKEVGEAYSALSDPQKRANYDRFGSAAEGFRGYEGFSGFGTGMDFDFGEIFDDFGFGKGFGANFSDIFGFGGQGRTRARKAKVGSNLRHDLTITLEEAAKGIEEEIEIIKRVKCGSCKGTGAENAETKTCDACRGQGVVMETVRIPFGTFATTSECRRCHGSGQIISKRCGKCDGRGFMGEKKKVKVKIPAGIDEGYHLRLEGMGNDGHDGSGDLFVLIFIEPHDVFRRDGSDIYAEIPISFSEAGLGTEIKVPTLDGSAKLKIPEGTQSGTIFRLAGQGIVKLGSASKGDEYVKIIVKTPDKLTKEQKKILEELSKTEKLSEKRESIIEKLKKKFGS